ncbi:MAG TPA: hypothetical protein VMR62_14605 [Bryobacteraceae bacterium]|nr:hypothetical protein [Bryobacteraceae bacterium]
MTATTSFAAKRKTLAHLNFSLRQFRNDSQLACGDHEKLLHDLQRHGGGPAGVAMGRAR